MTATSPGKPAFTANAAVGYSSAFIIMFIWAGWLVTSRAGVQSALTIHDIMAFRFGIAAVIAAPAVLYVKPWRSMTLRQIIIVTFLLGIPYTVTLFKAFDTAPAAHAAVFMNGILPALTIALAYILFSERPRIFQLIGTVLIIIGASCAAFGSVGFDFATTWPGDLLFILAGLFFAVYMTINRLWHLSMTQIWLCGSILNAILFIPVWWLFLPSGIAETPPDQLLLQMGYQGIVPNIIGLVLISVAVRNIGPSTTAAMMSGVPAFSAVLGFVFLGEALSWLGIVSLLILTPGIIIASLPAKPEPSRPEKLG